MKRLQPIVEDEVAEKLAAEGKLNGHKKVGVYAAHVLTKHVEKQEGDQRKGEKREYDKYYAIDIRNSNGRSACCDDNLYVG